jgi:hypothetical protein
VTTLSLGGCSHDWDGYDPRLAASSVGPSGPGGAGGIGGAAGGGAATGGQGGAGATGGAGGEAGAGGTMPCAIPLQDTFDDGVIGAAWYPYMNDGGLVEETGGELLVHLPDVTTASSFGGLSSAAQYDLTGCYVFVEVTGVPDPATEAYTQIVAGFAGPEESYVEVIQDAGAIVAKRIYNSEHTYLNSIPYDPVAHRYWRIREAAGSTYWELSPDAQSWTQLASEPTVVQLSGIIIGIGAGAYQVEPSPPGTARFDNLNTPP